MPQGVEIRVVEETSKNLFLVVPNLKITVKEQPTLDERSTRAELETSILVDAMVDGEAKAALLADPRRVYEAKVASVRSGAKLPSDMTVQAFEETDSVLYFRLPEAPPEQTGELTEEELAAVAGGVVAVGVAVASTAVVGAVIGLVLLVAEEEISKDQL